MMPRVARSPDRALLDREDLMTCSAAAVFVLLLPAWFRVGNREADAPYSHRGPGSLNLARRLPSSSRSVSSFRPSTRMPSISTSALSTHEAELAWQCLVFAARDSGAPTSVWTRLDAVAQSLGIRDDDDLFDTTVALVRQHVPRT